MVAFVTSLLLGLLSVAAVYWYGTTRRKPGDPLSWGQAYLAATYVALVLFWWYGIVPQQWMLWADSELNWNSGALLAGPGSGTLENAIPFTVNKMHLRDSVVVGIHVVAFSLQIYTWAWWNNRSKRADARAAEIPRSTYGRPLVKKG